MTSLTKILSYAVLIGAVASAGLPASAAPDSKRVCTVRDADAAVVEVVPADLPPLAEAAHMTGSAVVQFELDSRGIAHNPSIVTSTGHALLDDAAKRAALVQRYGAEIHDCDAVGGTYRIVVEFPASA